MKTSKTKILLLGGRGMLGSEILEALNRTNEKNDEFDVLALGHDKFDICNAKSLDGYFGDFVPDFVINCVAFTRVDDAEFDTERKIAFEVNAKALKGLAKLCKKYASILIHFSTDYVFDGRKTPPAGYDEKSIPNPLNAYGESKFQGEENVIKGTDKYYIVRTSWLYGKNSKNFVDTMLKMGAEVLEGKRKEIKVLGDQFGCPTYALGLAEAIVSEFLLKSQPFGIYHLTNEGPTNWHEFATEILKTKNIKPIKITTKEFPRPAKRPQNSILLNTKLPHLRSWKEALKDYLLF